jgi:hypothetical protein
VNVDLVGSVELTAAAAVMVAALSIAFGSDALARIRVAAWLTAWFVVVVILAATRTLYYEHGLGAPGLGMAVVLPVVVIWLLVARVQMLRAALGDVPLWLLICVHVVRILGVSFIILYAANRLPAPFAPVAGWGDILIGITAPLVAWLSWRQGANARPIVWIWNLAGTADLIAAVGLGVTSSPGPLRLFHGEPSSAIMATLPWLLIPGFLVPLLFVVHMGIFARLAATRKPGAQALPPALA